jgi:hypothetical protein
MSKVKELKVNSAECINNGDCRMFKLLDRGCLGSEEGGANQRWAEARLVLPDRCLRGEESGSGLGMASPPNKRMTRVDF